MNGSVSFVNPSAYALIVGDYRFVIGCASGGGVYRSLLTPYPLVCVRTYKTKLVSLNGSYS